MAVPKLILPAFRTKRPFVVRHLSCVIEEKVIKVEIVEILDHLLELKVHFNEGTYNACFTATAPKRPIYRPTNSCC